MLFMILNLFHENNSRNAFRVDQRFLHIPNRKKTDVALISNCLCLSRPTYKGHNLNHGLHRVFIRVENHIGKT